MHSWFHFIFCPCHLCPLFFPHTPFLLDVSAAFPVEPQNQAGIPPQSQIVTQEPLNLSKPNKEKPSLLQDVSGHIPGSFDLFVFFLKLQYLYKHKYIYIPSPPGGVLLKKFKGDTTIK